MAARRNERRALYSRVAKLRESVADDGSLLRACATAMRLLRKQRASEDLLAREILRDPVLHEVVAQDDALAQVRQAMSAPALEAAYRATAAHARKFANDEIPAVTQLFTPSWVVEFLLQNTLGRLWVEMHPDTGLRDHWRFLIDARSSRKIEPKVARELTILDPACGTMNFGIVAGRMLRAMYLEELERAGSPGWPQVASIRSQDEIESSVLRHNLFGIDIDAVALDLARETLAITFGCGHENLARADALFDSIPNDWPRAFDVVVTNPPYLSSRNLQSETVARMKKRYPTAWRDQCTCFLRRCVELCEEKGGRAGLLAMQTFMFTGGYESLRRELLSATAIEAIAHFGPGLFDVGNPGTLQTAAVVLRREADHQARDEQRVAAYRLVEAGDKRAALDRSATHSIRQSRLTVAPRAAFTYWLDDRTFEIFATFPKLGLIAPPKQGLATTNNARFVRYWWEVEPTCPDAPLRASPDTWFPYAKSGRFRRWYESPRHRVNWADDGREIKAEIVRRYPYLKGQWQWVAKNAQHYFKRGVTYSYLTSGPFSARLLEAGAIFDVAGSSLFPEDPLAMLAILNSSVARQLLHAINPTVNFQVGDLAELPVPNGVSNESHRDVERAIELTRMLDTFDETTPDFVAPMAWRDADEIHRSLTVELAAIERRIDLAVATAYGVPIQTSGKRVEDRVDRSDLARRWVSFVFRRALVTAGGVVRIAPLDPHVREVITEFLADQDVEVIAREVGGIESFLASPRGFIAWHARLYKRRPIVWIVGRPTRRYALLHDHATADVLRRIGRYASKGVSTVDDGIVHRLQALAGSDELDGHRDRLATAKAQ